MLKIRIFKDALERWRIFEIDNVNMGVMGAEKSENRCCFSNLS